MMKKVKSIGLLFLLLVGTVGPATGDQDSLGHRDEIIDYTLKLLRDKTGSPHSNQHEFDSDYAAVAKAYFQLDRQEEAFEIYFKIDCENERFSLLRDFIKSGTNKQPVFDRQIWKALSGINDPINRGALHRALVFNYLERSRRDLAEEFYRELEKCAVELDGPEELMLYWIDVLPMAGEFISHGLQVKAEKLYREIEKFLLEYDYFELTIALVREYHRLGMRKKINTLTTRINNQAEGDIGKLLHAGMVFIDLEEYKKARQIFSKTCQIVKLNKDAGTNFPALSDLAHFIENTRDRMVINFFGQPERTNLFPVDSPKNPGELSIEKYFNYAPIIKALVKTGHYQKAKELGAKLDEMFHTKKFTDIHHYSLGLIQAEAGKRESLLHRAHKIETRSLAIDLLLRAAGMYKEPGERNRARRILKSATLLLESKPDDFLPFGKAEQVIMGWIQGGYLNEAQKYTRALVKGRERSSLLYELVKKYIAGTDIPEATRITRGIEDIQYKALCYSKIASAKARAGNPGESAILFRKAIELIIRNNLPGLDTIMRDYLESKRSRQ